MSHWWLTSDSSWEGVSKLLNVFCLILSLVFSSEYNGYSSLQSIHKHCFILLYKRVIVTLYPLSKNIENIWPWGLIHFISWPSDWSPRNSALQFFNNIWNFNVTIIIWLKFLSHVWIVKGNGNLHAELINFIQYCGDKYCSSLNSITSNRFIFR